eukprot:12515441-Ditylum_brightwellii.AAC.1
MPTDDDEMVSNNDDVDMPEADGMSDDGKRFSRKVKRNIELLEKECDTLAKNANMGAIAEYQIKEAVYLSHIGELNKALKWGQA